MDPGGTGIDGLDPGQVLMNGCVLGGQTLVGLGELLVQQDPKEGTG